MSGTNSPQGGLTRRSFLKTTGAAGALGLAGAVGMATATDWFVPVEAAAEPEEKVAYTYHQAHCYGNCMLKCTTRDGRLCLIEPNDAMSEGFQTVCVKGLSEIQHVYSVDRIQTPLKRVGERGSGEFQAVTWDEAMEYFAQEIGKCWKEYGPASVALGSSTESETMLELANVLGTTFAGSGIDIGMANGLAPMTGSMMGGVYNNVGDFTNTATLLVVGTNFLESGMVHSKYFFDAKDAGMHSIAIDPHFCTTASKCDEWIPIEPGTDGALYLAMISCVLENGWVDEEFVLAHTSFPFLVSEEDGLSLRDHVDATGLEDAVANPYMVWDSAGNCAVPYTDKAAIPVLEGEFEINGKRYATAFSLLKKNQEQYTPEWAAEVTGIPAERIRDLAKRYATAGPAMVAYGYGGIDKYLNSDTVAHALGMLVALTGNFGKPGSGVGTVGDGGWEATYLPSWPVNRVSAYDPAAVPSYELPYVENKIHAFISIGDQLQQKFADFNSALAWAKTLDFFVYADVYYGTGANYADLVLPICSRFECEEEFGGLRGEKGHLMLRQKVIEPLFDSKSDFALEYAMAKALGIEDCLPETTEERLRWQLENPLDPRLTGITLESLSANQGVFAFASGGASVAGESVPTFLTATGKLQVYYDNMVPFGQGLPNYVGPTETAADNPLREQYPLQLATLRTRFHIHNQFCDATWIQQFLTARVELNPVDMEARGLSSGDIVEVFNDRGSFSCPALSNESIRPGSARVFEGEWSKFMMSGNVQNVTNPSIDDRGRVQMYGPVIPFNDTLVEVKKA